MKKLNMNSEGEDFEKRKEGSLTPEDKESSGFKKILDEQEDSSLSSNDYGGSNEESTATQLSSDNRASISELSQPKNLPQSDIESRHTLPPKPMNSDPPEGQREDILKKCNTIQRSFSTISARLVASTLPRLSSSNSLKGQSPKTSNESSPEVKQEKIKTDDPYGEVARGLESCYKKVLLPFEEKCNFHQFHYTKYDDCEFEAKPFVLLIGQYSTGKTSFIQYMAGEDYPGINIGPEPTTDKFTIILHGKEKKVIAGNSLVLHKQLPFRSLQKFGNSFLSRLQCSMVDSSMLNGLALIDTPGILAGQQQFGKERGYDFPAVLEWFAERVDRILILFDAHKLDISDEFKRVLDAMKPYEEKVRIVLNKSDMLEPQQLFRIYGSLMWSLGKSISCPEAVRVYVGSFWDKPYQYQDWRELFEYEQSELFQDLKTLPQMSASRKINDFSKRIKLAKAHALVLAEIRRQMPSFSFFKDKKKQEIINGLDIIYNKIQRELDMCEGDFPDLRNMQEKLKILDWNKFRDVKKRDLDRLDKLLSHDLANLINAIPTVGDMRHGGEFPEQPTRKKSGIYKNKGRKAFYTNGSAIKERKSTGYEYGGTIEFEIPYRKFGQSQKEEEVNSKKDVENWIVYTANPGNFEAWRAMFNSFNPICGKISKAIGNLVFQNSGLSDYGVSMIWKLADLDKDGMLNCNEFCLGMYLIELHFKGDIELPSDLPTYLYPPSMMKNNI